MSTIFDTYVKLLIAILTLLIPLLIFYLNIVTNARNLKIKKFDEDINQIKKDTASNMGDAGNAGEEESEDFVSNIADLNQKIVRLKNSKQRDLNLLNPLRQLIRIYTPLILAFVIMLIEFAIKDHTLNLYDHKLSCILISSSFALFMTAIIFIVQVALTAIKCKIDIDNSSLENGN